MLSVCAKHPSAQIFSEMATARNTTSESAEGLVVKSLAKAKLQFPLMTEKFRVKFLLVAFAAGIARCPPLLFCDKKSGHAQSAGADFLVINF